jgi:transglutaminase/protease-like cytokinesis protein 3
MKTKIILIPVLIFMILFLSLLFSLYSSSGLAVSDSPGVSEGGAQKKLSQESLTITPNDFDSKINYSYYNIDQHAINTPSSAEASVDSLASYLVAPAKNEREKARSIFRWVTENIDYDVSGFFAGSFDDTNSKDVLKSRKSVCGGYSDIFSTLASSAGLEVVRIAGYGKGYGYMPGENLSAPSNHAWNAVKINGSWYLIDCTWGAGYIDDDKKYVRRFDDHYFMTPPSEFIYDHFPEDSRWQLLEHPLSKSEFEKQAFLKPEFFKYGLKLDDRLEGTIRAVKEVNISIFTPNDVLLMAGLERMDRKTSKKLENYVFVESNGSRYDIFAQFPEIGKYILKVYAKQKDEPGEYHGAVEYLINATAADDVNTGFPMTYGKFTEAGAYLYSPMDGRLKSGVPYRFKIRVPNAKNVTVVCGDDWSHLGSSGDLFEGNVTVKKGDVVVYAKFQGEKYDGLLKYAGY